MRVNLGGKVEAWRERRTSQFYAVGSKDETRGNGECQFDPETGGLQLPLLVSGAPCKPGSERSPKAVRPASTSGSAGGC